MFVLGDLGVRNEIIVFCPPSINSPHHLIYEAYKTFLALARPIAIACAASTNEIGDFLL